MPFHSIGGVVLHNIFFCKRFWIVLLLIFYGMYGWQNNIQNLRFGTYKYLPTKCTINYQILIKRGPLLFIEIKINWRTDKKISFQDRQIYDYVDIKGKFATVRFTVLILYTCAYKYHTLFLLTVVTVSDISTTTSIVPERIQPSMSIQRRHRHSLPVALSLCIRMGTAAAGHEQQWRNSKIEFQIQKRIVEVYWLIA